ncbi:hypothetical protein AAG570_010492 [Ranatra chinensis]|uniref:Uncharacterized protein n=1 Tax=Ranatra chinensis TaxID=642074 RepID=A0ABD0YYQ5_9HEMI
MASKRQNMFYQYRKQETMEIGTCNLPSFRDCMSCRPSDISLFNSVPDQEAGEDGNWLPARVPSRTLMGSDPECVVNQSIDSLPTSNPIQTHSLTLCPPAPTVQVEETVASGPCSGYGDAQTLILFAMLLSSAQWSWIRTGVTPRTSYGANVSLIFEKGSLDGFVDSGNVKVVMYGLIDIIPDSGSVFFFGWTPEFIADLFVAFGRNIVAYSPDPVASDFHFFTKSNEFLAGKRLGGLELGIGFSEEPSSTTAVRNKPLLLGCVPSTPATTVAWTLDDQPLQLDSRHHIQPNGSLYIKRLLLEGYCFWVVTTVSSSQVEENIEYLVYNVIKELKHSFYSVRSVVG